MRGVGGPLLCISDLLSDVGDDDNNNNSSDDSGGSETNHHSPSSTVDISNPTATHLPKLFQDNFSELNTALEGADHSWTALTLKLCSALESANKLVDSTNSRVSFLTEKVEELGQIVSRRDSAITATKAIQASRKL